VLKDISIDIDVMTGLPVQRHTMADGTDNLCNLTGHLNQCTTPILSEANFNAL
jgi:hypothetical protein